MKSNDIQRFTNLIFEASSLRKIAKSHRQTLLTDDLSDNIASHSYTVIVIAYLLAKAEKVDVEKVVTMAIFHDLGEARSGDQNWVNKRYVKVDEEEILDDQLEHLTPDNKLHKIMKEYNERKTKEAKVAKDADLLGQIILLKEYSEQGNKEADDWLNGGEQKKRLYSKTAKAIAKQIETTSTHDWWDNIWTQERK